ncbi:MAG: hypothetical protein GC185_00005, partial [Alphaproteobacteria bacterium]|nr:hypothetical protein [Alphaproteobacteria bacterium]
MSQNRVKKFQPRAGATVMTLVMFAILVSLGVWQVHRLAWKTQLLASIARDMAQKPLPLPENPDPKALDYHRVTMTGRFLYAHEYLVKPRVMDGVDGFDMIVPFKRVSGGVVFVDRGWASDAVMREAARALVAMGIDSRALAEVTVGAYDALYLDPQFFRAGGWPSLEWRSKVGPAVAPRGAWTRGRAGGRAGGGEGGGGRGAGEGCCDVWLGAAGRGQEAWRWGGMLGASLGVAAACAAVSECIGGVAVDRVGQEVDRIDQGDDRRQQQQQQQSSSSWWRGRVMDCAGGGGSFPPASPPSSNGKNGSNGSSRGPVGLGSTLRLPGAAAAAGAGPGGKAQGDGQVWRRRVVDYYRARRPEGWGLVGEQLGVEVTEGCMHQKVWLLVSAWYGLRGSVGTLGAGIGGWRWGGV